jgi:nitrogenase molybdenum-iron protein alpha/beta subunit
MEHRNQILRVNKIRIFPENYDITVKALMECLKRIPEAHTNPVFICIINIDEDQRGFGSMELDPVMGTSFYVKYSYYSPETDTEFENRMKHQERLKRDTEEREKLEYLRLKAKFETT